MFVLYNPEPQAKYFTDMVQALEGALHDLQLPVVTQDRLRTDEMVARQPNAHVYVLFGSHRHSYYFNWRLRYIAFNYEQVNDKMVFGSAPYMRILQRAWRVWDYSYLNQARLAERGITATVIPLGYHAQLVSRVRHPECDGIPTHGAQANPQPHPSESIATDDEPIDILFYGLPSVRRHDIIGRLRSAGLCVTWFQDNCWLQTRARLLARTHVVINLHSGHHHPTVLEQSRIVPAVAAGKLVISERSDDTRSDALFADVVVFADHVDEMIRLCQHYLSHAAVREAEALLRSRRLRESFPYADLLIQAGVDKLLGDKVATHGSDGLANGSDGKSALTLECSES